MGGYIEHFPAKCEAVRRRKCDQVNKIGAGRRRQNPD
jgi:hypothetical protein